MSETTSSQGTDEGRTDHGVGTDQVEDTVVAGDAGSSVTDDLTVAPAGSEDALEQVQDDDAAEDDEDDDEPENPLEAEAEVAADYLEELLDIADLDGDIDTFIEGDRAHVSIVSESKVLVGPDGAVLDALQELTRLAVMTETGNRSRLMLDVAGYRETRRRELLEVAGNAVTQVRESGERMSLEPMNPFERKIVHDAVASAGLVSESKGEEPRRRVVVLPAS
ncbi:Jag family protein [Microlunatus flavus]|uniref:SpoIIIJ-associated protein n=2 Tax=Microlunatus flavus TaxID=1036181 RepID=A0A1H9NRZ6_9ACTN|nr:spoIIIJ-associated protein [Microlunatus flavus]